MKKLPGSIIAVFAIVLGIIFFTGVLPYQIPNQYEPTIDDLSAGGYYDYT